jgi:hypothetical protein
MTKEEIAAEAEAFFEWPTSDRTAVHTTSALVFTKVCVDMAVAKERDRTIGILLKHMSDPFAKWDDAVKAAMEEIREP